MPDMQTQEDSGGAPQVETGKVKSEMTFDELMDVMKSELKNTNQDELASMIDDKISEHRKEWEEQSEAERKKAEQLNYLKAGMVDPGTRAGVASNLAKSDATMKVAELLPIVAKAGATHETHKKSGMDLAKKVGRDHVAKALEVSNYEAAGVLLDTETSSEFTQALYADNIVRALGARTLDISDGELKVNKQNVSATFGWAGEGVRMTVSNPEFGDQTLSRNKGYVLVPITAEMLDRLPAGYEQIIRDDMVAVTQNGFDLAYIRGDGNNDQPLGILNQTASGNKFDGTDDPTLAETATDLINAMYLVDTANIPMMSTGWMFHPRTKYELMSIRTSDGFPVYQQELANGTLYGHAYGTSTQIPTNKTGDSDETEVYFGDFSQVIIGEDSQMRISESDSASFVDADSNTVHGFQEDITLMKLTMFTDIVVRRSDAFGIIENWDIGNELDA